MKKNIKDDEPNLNDHKGINKAAIEEAVSLGEHIASNERAMKLLKEDNDVLRKRLQEMFESFQIPWLKISIPIDSHGGKQDYTIQMVSARGYIPPEGGIKKILSVRIKGLFPDWEIDKRKRIAKKLTDWLTPFLRKDAIVLSETRKYPWGVTLEEDKTVTPYLYLTEGFHDVG
jgi:hypothetical protein